MTMPGFATPRIAAQRCVASMTTPTPSGWSLLHEQVRDLLGEALLDLEAAGVHVDDARHLREPDDAPVGDVGDRRRAEERQQVVLAERVERDVLDDDHLAVVDLEDGAVEEPGGILAISGHQLAVHPVDAVGRADETGSVGVLPDLGEDLAHGGLDPPVGRAVVGVAQVTEGRSGGSVPAAVSAARVPVASAAGSSLIALGISSRAVFTVRPSASPILGSMLGPRQIRMTPRIATKTRRMSTVATWYPAAAHSPASPSRSR